MITQFYILYRPFNTSISSTSIDNLKANDLIFIIAIQVSFKELITKSLKRILEAIPICIKSISIHFIKSSYSFYKASAISRLRNLYLCHYSLFHFLNMRNHTNFPSLSLEIIQSIHCNTKCIDI